MSDIVVKVLNDAGDVIADAFQPEKHEIQQDIKKAIAIAEQQAKVIESIRLARRGFFGYHERVSEELAALDKMENDK